MTVLHEPYANDALGRMEYAKGLSKLIYRIPKGVIAIDGDWGVGKSWFGAQLKLDLDAQKQVGTVWIDSFLADWDDDPALSIISSIAEELEPEHQATLIEKAAPLLSKVLPIATKAAIKSAGNFIGINKDVLDGVAEAVKAGSESYIKKHLAEATEKRRGLVEIKQLLTASVQEGKFKKLVIFVDELDRCSPRYAVRFLERLNHLFDLDGVVYVLLWNREQIQRTVEAFYGTGSNGQMYLDKFVDYPFHLPISQWRSNEDPMEGLIGQLVKAQADVQQQSALYDNAHVISKIAAILKLNARETQRVAAWWVVSTTRRFVLLETWLLGLKVKAPNIFAGIRINDPKAHMAAMDLLKGVNVSEDANGNLVMALIDLHNRYAKNDFKDMEATHARHFSDAYNTPSVAIKTSIRRLEATFG